MSYPWDSLLVTWTYAEIQAYLHDDHGWILSSAIRHGSALPLATHDVLLLRLLLRLELLGDWRGPSAGASFCRLRH